MIEIKIKLEGTFPGAAERRFSIDALGEPMSKLLQATRSIASQIVMNALDEAEYGAAGGRRAKDAATLDLQLEKIEEGSVVLRIMLVMGLMQGRLFEELPVKTGEVLVESIKAESAGRPTRGVVRKYLSSLPPGVTAQRYELFDNGRLISEAAFGTAELPVVPDLLPYLISTPAQVIGVGFETGKTEVRIRTEDGHATTLSATPEQVDAALEIRSGSVHVRAVVNKKSYRLISIRPMSQEPSDLSDGQKTALVFDKWAGLLKRLA
jgi:hypothetical protein